MNDFKSDYDLATNIWDRVSLIIKNKWKENDLSNDINKYRTHLFETFGKVRVLGMNESVNVEDIYVDLNVLAKKRETDRVLEKKDFSYADLSDHKPHSGRRRNSSDVIKEIQNLFIIGKPGAGKTTLLKHITIKALSTKDNNGHIPVFITLKEFSENKTNDTLHKQIINQFEINSFSHAKPFVNKMLEDGNFMILLDGLDEVSKSEVKRIINDVRTFARRFLQK